MKTRKTTFEQHQEHDSLHSYSAPVEACFPRLFHSSREVIRLLGFVSLGFSTFFELLDSSSPFSVVVLGATAELVTSIGASAGSLDSSSAVPVRMWVLPFNFYFTLLKGTLIWEAPQALLSLPLTGHRNGTKHEIRTRDTNTVTVPILTLVTVIPLILVISYMIMAKNKDFNSLTLSCSELY